MSEREQVWRERIEWQQRSGLTVAECCKSERVSEASFYRWKKLLTDHQSAVADERPRSPRRTAVQASGSKERVAQFVPIAVRDSSTSPGPRQSIASNHGNSMRIELPNGVIIHVAGDLDGQRLGDVVIAAGQIRSDLADVTTHGLLQHEVLSC